MTAAIDIDIAIIGGGIAGLWLLNRLRTRGYGVLLIESERLGAGQTLLSQGIIHGGAKYALQGEISEAAQAIGAMPDLWRRCLAGAGEVNLASVQVLARHQYLWTSASLGSRLAGFFASKVMSSRMDSLDPEEYPLPLRQPGLRGKVYRLDEPVLNTRSLLEALAAPHRDALAKCQGPAAPAPDGTITLRAPEQNSLVIRPQRTVFTAGIGNAALPWAAAQIRPLHMVLVRGEHLPGGLYAHCLGVSDVPRLTITSHRDLRSRTVWYLGGQLAEDGVKRDPRQQIQAARRELADLLPWVDLSKAQFSTLQARRIEARHPTGKRPDRPTVLHSGGVIAAWPTKLAMAPMLAARVLSLLEQEELRPRHPNLELLHDWPRPLLGIYPWDQEDRKWY